MPFVNRREELHRLETLAASVRRGRVERHLAFIGPRRMGKSRLVEHYVESNRNQVSVVIPVDAVTTNPQAFLVGVVRATVGAFARLRRQAVLPAIASPSEVAAAAGLVGNSVATLTTAALERASGRRADAQELLGAAITFPESVATAMDEPIVVFADEFQHLLDLAAYPPFDGGRRRPVDEAQLDLLQVFRSHVERQPNVGWVVSGSAIRIMQRVLRGGPLMGRFDERLLGPFDTVDSAQLASEIWEEIGVEATDSAVERVFRLTQGHPFYADVVCREAAIAALRLDRPVSASMVDGAFVDSVRRPNGAIAIACRETYESLTHRAPNLREVLHVLARDEPRTVAEIADRAQVASAPLAYRHTQELAEMGLLLEVAPRTYRFADPVLRYWVAVANDPLTADPVLLDAVAARRVARVYEEAFLREREAHGPLQEGYLRDLCRSFAGQQVDGRRLGRRGQRLSLPHVSRVTSITGFDETGEVFGRPAEVELDLSFGDDVPWLGEVRRRNKRATAADIDLAARKAVFLRRLHALPAGPTWFVSMSGFEEAARDRARVLDVYTSDARDVESLRSEVGTARPSRD